MMRYRYHRGNRYRFTNPPKAILNARLDNIAIVPASMLPFKTTWQKTANKLPKRGVLLCHSRKNTRQKKLLEQVEEVFKRLGYAVMNLPIEQVV
jgi:predicted enzyme involved in methoxymalonyl-ACP biosynthesis